MRKRHITAIVLAGLGLMGLPVLAGQPTRVRPPVTEESIRAGREIYMTTCSWCHGLAGQGDGPVPYFQSRTRAPRPRDFTTATFKFRTTASGEMPLEQDLFNTITRGVPGFMPSFTSLSVERRWQVIYYVKSFAKEAWETEPEPIPVGDPVTSSATSIERGEELYQLFRCAECHGSSGQGDGPAAGEQRDDWGFLDLATDLTRPESFRNGHRREDIYRTFVTGLNGTPMPSYKDSLPNLEDGWHLVNFILSLSAQE